MSCDDEWCNNTVVVATPCLFKIPIQVISSIEESRPITITPRNIARNQTLHLGHLSEWHSLSLIPAAPEHTIFHEPRLNDYLCDGCGEFLSDIYHENRQDFETLICESCGVKDTTEINTILSVDRQNCTDTNSSATILVASPKHFDDNEVSMRKPHTGPNNSTDKIESFRNQIFPGKTGVISLEFRVQNEANTVRHQQLELEQHY